jgi:hypothetical protein
MICPDCLTQAIDLLKSHHLALLTQANKAESDKRTRIHGRVLRTQAAGMGAAVAVLRDRAREQVGE